MLGGEDFGVLVLNVAVVAECVLSQEIKRSHPRRMESSIMFPFNTM
jgi:hypothetical protein